jgi:hypothetical protein
MQMSGSGAETTLLLLRGNNRGTISAMPGDHDIAE